MSTKVKTTPTESISNIIEKDCANIACLLDMLTDHPAIQDSAILNGYTSMLKAQYLLLWERLEIACEQTA